MSGASITAEPSPRKAPPPDIPAGESRWRRLLIAAAFLAPAATLLGIWIVYPAIRRSSAASSTHRKPLRRVRELQGAVHVRPAPDRDQEQRAVGRDRARVRDRAGADLRRPHRAVRFSVVFKTVVFMPMAISLFAAGVIWRLMYMQDPSQGTVNAAIAAVKGVFEPQGVLPEALPSHAAARRQARRQLTLKTPLEPGESPLLGLSAIPPRGCSGRRQAGGEAPGEARRHHRRRLERFQAGRRQARHGRAG